MEDNQKERLIGLSFWFLLPAVISTQNICYI